MEGIEKYFMILSDALYEHPGGGEFCNHDNCIFCEFTVNSQCIFNFIEHYFDDVDLWDFKDRK